MDNLLFILKTVKKHPELVLYLYEDEISCMTDDLSFSIRSCCSNSGCTITFDDNSTLDLSANEEV